MRLDTFISHYPRPVSSISARGCDRLPQVLNFGKTA